MRILILSQYFPPETGAPQNRLFELAIRLKSRGHEVFVLTAMPNYPSMKVFEGYRGKLFLREKLEGLEVMRSAIYASKNSGLFHRLLNYFSFVFTSFFVGLFAKRFDFIMCESPPLFLGWTAVLLSKLKRMRLIFNVSDLWPESAEKLGLVSNKIALGMSYTLEAWIYRNSFIITGQTQGIVKDISSRFKGRRTYWLPNGVDTKRYDPQSIRLDWRKSAGFSQDQFLLLYAGILGHAQGLTVLLEAAKKLGETNVQFVLLGEGPEKEELKYRAQWMELKNVHFLPGVPRDKMKEIVAGVDAAVVPLRKLDLFKGAIPSKIFENLAMEKPIFLGVEGEAKELFIDQANAGWFFEPENADALASAVQNALKDPARVAQCGQNGRRFVIEHFDRDTIVERFDDYLNKFDQ